jgi:precorrin-6A/cobalt-precorrin-6A reductase
MARALAGDARFEPTLSLAGRTEQPAAVPVPVRTGGFGGVEGLARTLAEHRIDMLIDATHPFAAQMKRNAVDAAALAGVKLLAIRRPPWVAEDGDCWSMVATMDEAAAALGAEPKRVFLTIGRKDLGPFAGAPQHVYLVRSVDAPPPEALPPRVKVITARGPFALAEECNLLEEHKIEIIVTKNSGGTATAAKLEAARALNLPVVMVRRPELPHTESVATVPEALAWLERHHEVTTSA